MSRIRSVEKMIDYLSESGTRREKKHIDEFKDILQMDTCENIHKNIQMKMRREGRAQQEVLQ